MTKDKQSKHADSEPVFIHGQMPRCGTNFVIDVLGNHSDIFREPNEIWEFHHFVQVKYLHNYMSKLKQSKHMQKFDEIQMRRHIGTAWLNYMKEYMQDINKHILLKEPSVENLEYFFDYFPHAYLLIIVRDGRNAVASAMKSGFVGRWTFKIWDYHSWKRLIGPSKFEVICKQWNESALKVADLITNSFSAMKDKVLLIKYEDLYQDLFKVVERILDFCALSRDTFDWNALKNMPVRGSSFLQNDDGKMDFAKGVVRDSKFDPLHRWHNWTKQEHTAFKKGCTDGMHALGYSFQEAEYT